ncbi:MAG: hypothetical protein LBG71_05075 [Clostridiales Family XIII bacterium]|jgi:hypothetical protein|nr:hypothetical protein [Clostridiales Family XIII bacterium]
MGRDIIAVEFKSLDTKRDTTVIGVVNIELLDDGLLLVTEDRSKSVKLTEEPIRRKEIKLHVYYPSHEDIEALLGNKGMFKHGLEIVDGRISND